MTLPIRIDPHSAPDETLHVTASGLPVRVYATDCGGSYPIHGAIFRDGKWQPRSWDANGTYLPGEYEDYFDLRDRPMTYNEAMEALNEAVYAAVRAADNEDGAPVEALRELAAEVDSLIDHRMTRAEMNDARRLYEGTRQAGMVG